MKTRLVLLALSLQTAAFAQEYLGAAKAIERIATETAQPKIADEKKKDPAALWAVRVADFAGSTSGMIKYVKDNKPAKVLLVTECSMAANVALEAPDTEFIKPCNLCPHMKRITLPKILDSLLNLTEEVFVDPAIADRARLAVERMINLKN